MYIYIYEMSMEWLRWWLQEFYTWKKGRKGERKCLYKKQEPNLYAKKERQEEGNFLIKVQDDMMIGGNKFERGCVGGNDARDELCKR